MKSRKRRSLGFAVASLVVAGAARGTAGQSAGEILQASGVSAGLAVRVGTTDGALEAELTGGGTMLVHPEGHPRESRHADPAGDRRAGRPEAPVSR